MAPIDTDILADLRSMALEGSPASEILKEAAAQLGIEKNQKLLLIDCFRQTFGSSLQDASPIAGWFPPGESELNDERFDGLMRPVLEKWAKEKGNDNKEGGNRPGVSRHRQAPP